MAGYEVSHVIGEGIVPFKLVDGDDVIDGGRHGVRPFEFDIDEFSAFVAYLGCGKHSGFGVFKAPAFSP